jgi:hypothetical protein
VDTLWSDLKERKMEEIYGMIAPGFQAVDKTGLRDRDQEIEYIDGLHSNQYSLNDLKVTLNGPVYLIVFLQKEHSRANLSQLNQAADFGVG